MCVCNLRTIFNLRTISNSLPIIQTIQMITYISERELFVLELLD